MRKTLRFLVYSMLAMVCLFTACSDDDDNDSGRIVQYPLPERMQLDVTDNEPVLVKTETEFNDLFGTYASQLPKVDFNQYDLVYGQGGAEYGVVSFESWIDGTEPPYRLVVHIQQNYTLPYVRWAVELHASICALGSGLSFAQERQEPSDDGRERRDGRGDGF